MVCGLISFSLSMQAQTKAGGIDKQMMEKITVGNSSSANRALANAIATNSIDDLARNFKKEGSFDTHFSVETTKQNIHNQKEFGTLLALFGLECVAFKLRAQAQRHAARRAFARLP